MPAAAHAPAAVPDRVRLARVARAAALAVDGVAAVTSAGSWARSVATGDGRLDGVTCVARPGGGYDVTLYLAARPVPLQALADEVRDVVRIMTRAARLGDRLAQVDVVVCELRTGRELA